MLFLNISSDKVYLADGKREIWLERNGIEDIFWPTLIDWHQKSPFSEVFVLNWPGGFTNLRVWTLVLNLFSALNVWKISYFTVTKLDLYRFLFEKSFLPRMWLIYLGQKHNVWEYDCQKDVYKSVVLEQITWDFFLDAVAAEYWPENLGKKIEFSVVENDVIVKYAGKEYIVNPKILWLKILSQVSPEYFISPLMHNGK